jgi:type IV pilus assembly protein PilQ
MARPEQTRGRLARRAFLGAGALVLMLAGPGRAETEPAPGEPEARISIDVKDADVVDVVRLLAEVGGFQLVVHPGVACRLTLALDEVRWPTVLDLALKSCGLAQEHDGGVVRVAKAAQLTDEAAQRRRYEEERRTSAPPQVSFQRLSYARAQELAPIVKRFLSPRGEVVYDARTNTLIIID